MTPEEKRTFWQVYELEKDFIAALRDDLNTPLAIQILHRLADIINKTDHEMLSMHAAETLQRLGKTFMGIFYKTPTEWFQDPKSNQTDNTQEIEELILSRREAKETKNYQEADRIRKILQDQGIILEDSPDGTKWRRE